MSSSTIPIRGQMGVTVTRQPGEPWSMVYRRGVSELLEISRRHGGDGLVALSPAWIAGDQLRITAHACGR
jgi:hypothetical protein